MRIVVGSDHAGLPLKQSLRNGILTEYDVQDDVGAFDAASSDYPRFALRAARMVASGRADLGLLICGTGIGMALAASRVRGVRPAVCTSCYTARMARAHNNANVLCLGGRVLGVGLAEEIVRAFLSTSFEGGRHAQRLKMIEDEHD